MSKKTYPDHYKLNCCEYVQHICFGANSTAKLDWFIKESRSTISIWIVLHINLFYSHELTYDLSNGIALNAVVLLNDTSLPTLFELMGAW